MSRLRLNKITTPASPAANKAELYYSSTLSPAALAAIDESGNIARVAGFTTKDYRLVRRLYLYNGTVSYTPTAGTQALHIEGIGGSGAGGGAASSTGGTNNSVGGGGGGGGGARVWLTTLVTGACVVAIGAAGSVGAAGNVVGGNGGATTFTDTGSTLRLQANGGTGGAGGGASATALGGRGAGGAGGTASGTPAESVTGTTWQGEDGDWGVAFSIVAATGMLSGKGGGSQYGSGGPGVQASATGSAGRKYGGGGAGGADAATTNRTGGAGAVGIMIVEEWA